MHTNPVVIARDSCQQRRHAQLSLLNLVEREAAILASAPRDQHSGVSEATGI